MYSTMIFTSLILSIMSKSITHPVTFMSVILGQTLVICICSTLMVSSSWFAFILFLIFMGGIMVLFIYMSSLASNENFMLEKNMILFYLPTCSAIFFIMKNLPVSLISSINSKSSFFLVHLFSFKFLNLMICLIIYLLFTLLIVSNVVKKNKAPIRSLK